jgi:hypothetical protein
MRGYRVYGPPNVGSWMAMMKYDQRQRARVRRSMRSLFSPISAIFVVALVSLLLAGCAGLLSSKQTTPDHEGLAASGASVSSTTTTTLSLHERIQQEQAEDAHDVAATTSTDAASETDSTANTSTTSTTLAPVYVLSDGSTMSPEEFEDVQTYVDGVSALAEQQYELAYALDPASNFDFLDFTAQDFEDYRQAVAQQEALRNTVAAIPVPAFMAESHGLRTLAADQFYEIASTAIVELERGGFYRGGSSLLAQIRSRFEVAMSTLADAEFGLQIWQQLSEGAFLQ